MGFTNSLILLLKLCFKAMLLLLSISLFQISLVFCLRKRYLTQNCVQRLYSMCFHKYPKLKSICRKKFPYLIYKVPMCFVKRFQWWANMEERQGVTFTDTFICTDLLFLIHMFWTTKRNTSHSRSLTHFCLKVMCFGKNITFNHHGYVFW